VHRSGTRHAHDSNLMILLAKDARNAKSLTVGVGLRLSHRQTPPEKQAATRLAHETLVRNGATEETPRFGVNACTSIGAASARAAQVGPGASS